MEKNIPVIKILEDNNLLQDIQCHLLVQPFELIVRNLNSLYEIKLKQNEDPEELNDLIGECSLYAMKLIVVAVYNAEQFQYYLTKYSRFMTKQHLPDLLDFVLQQKNVNILEIIIHLLEMSEEYLRAILEVSEEYLRASLPGWERIRSQVLDLLQKDEGI